MAICTCPGRAVHMVNPPPYCLIHEQGRLEADKVNHILGCRGPGECAEHAALRRALRELVERETPIIDRLS